MISCDHQPSSMNKIESEDHMAIGRTDKLLICKHPALEHFPHQQVVSDLFEFSYESANVINRWHLGDDGWQDVPNFQTYWKTFTRKFCYPERLVDSMGLPTEVGQVVRRDANTIMKHLVKYYADHQAQMPNPSEPENVGNLSEVLIYGTISFKALRMMNTLFGLKTAGKVHEYAELAETRVKLPNDVKLDIFDFVPETQRENPNGPDFTTQYVLLQKLHVNPTARKHFEQLVKYGFAAFHDLTNPKGYGAGRPRQGVALTPWGVRFYELFLERYDPVIMKEVKMRQDYAEWNT